MENVELDVALEELESRLERLRALYEQYFMGIERIEPQIPRKDIDRRIYVLRREKIRNTAKRFKLQTIISRYNTFQQYWMRICREIEAGTYKRHVIKAERIAPGQLLTIAARRRLGRHVFEDAAAEPAAPTTLSGSAPPNAVASSAPPPGNGPVLPSIPRLVGGDAANASLAGAMPAKPVPPPKPVPPAKPGSRPEKPAAASPAAPIPAAARRFESLDLDMDFMGDWDPTLAPTRASGGVPAVPARPFGEALARPLGAAPNAGAGLGAAPKAGSTGRQLGPSGAAAPTPDGTPAPQSPEPAAFAPKPPTPHPGTAAQPARMAGAGISPAGKLGAAPLAKAAPTSGAVLSDDRVRELHARLVEAKRQTKDAGAVSIEGLTKSLKATEAKLREQHKNRKIDFEVVIKDGKAVLKPIVR